MLIYMTLDSMFSGLSCCVSAQVVSWCFEGS